MQWRFIMLLKNRAGVWVESCKGFWLSSSWPSIAEGRFSLVCLLHTSDAFLSSVLFWLKLQQSALARGLLSSVSSLPDSDLGPPLSSVDIPITHVKKRSKPQGLCQGGFYLAC